MCGASILKSCDIFGFGQKGMYICTPIWNQNTKQKNEYKTTIARADVLDHVSAFVCTGPTLIWKNTTYVQW